MAVRRLPAVVPRDERAPIIEHAEIAPRHFRLRVHAPYIAERAEPGQFVQVRVAPAYDPLLRRPLSVSDTDAKEGWVEVVYRIVGRGTHVLAERRTGETLSVLGPLGHPFRLPEGGTIVLVGGGVGMPPLHFAARRFASNRISVVQGARTASLLLYEKEFDALAVRHYRATEDGTAGVHGLVTDALRDVLVSLDGPMEVLSCGPTAMMAAVARMAHERSIPCQVSLEERMACGFGICMGCAVKLERGSGSAQEYALVCVDGPVFSAEAVFGT